MKAAPRRQPVLLALLCCVCACAALPVAPWRVSRVAPRRGHAVASSADPSDDNGALYFDQITDHFAPGAEAVTWRQRFFANASFYKTSTRPSPVFLCIGGEGPPLEASVVVTGDFHCADAVLLAQKAGALLLALEHRFYGASIPTDDFSVASLRLLSMKQAVADVGTFVAYATARFLLPPDTLWVSFGGSYPGMVAAWSRAFLPHLIHGAVASSAPLHAVLDYEGYNDVVASALSDPLVGGSEQCLSAVSDAFASLGDAASSAPDEIGALFPLCHAIDTPGVAAQLFEELQELFPAQGNDPICDDGCLNIASACAAMTNVSVGSPLARLAKLAAAAVAPDACWGASDADVDTMMANTSLIGGTARPWAWQACTTFGFFQTCNPSSSCPFVSRPWTNTLAASLARCDAALGLGSDASSYRASVDSTNLFTGALRPAASRLLFINGGVDPWRAASVLTVPPGPALAVLDVPGASHHAWTHPPRAADSARLVAAREAIFQTVTSWLAQPGGVWDAPPPPACPPNTSEAAIANAVLGALAAAAAALLGLRACRAGGGGGVEGEVQAPAPAAAADAGDRLAAPLLEQA